VLNYFKDGSDGWYPSAGLVFDSAGNLYGTTYYGGNYSGTHCQAFGCGTAFRLTPNGAKTILYAFAGSPDGANPYAGLITYKGNFYGTTLLGEILA